MGNKKQTVPERMDEIEWIMKELRKKLGKTNDMQLAEAIVQELSRLEHEWIRLNGGY